MVFNHTPAAVTVLEGLRARLPEAKVEFAHGPEIRRDITSPFDDMMFEAKPVQTPEQAEVAFQTAVATARAADIIVMVLGENADMSGEAALACLAPICRDGRRSCSRQSWLSASPWSLCF